jgi:ABC-type nitrate/sulfonate/bicarbonate transport system ATPase subunit/ABC-type nitrate/sulfonate/bicarbonate transport system permease component
MSLIVAIALWDIGSRVSKSRLIPSPRASVQALWELLSQGVLLPDCFSSIERVLVGFTLAAITGVAVGLLSGMISSARTALAPIIEFLRPIPPIAWIPISIILFGIGDPSAYFVIFIGAFYPILSNTVLGVQEVSPVHLDAAKSMGASSYRSFAHVVWPSALPNIFTGLRIGLGFAWMCVIAAEMIAAKSGIGYEIQLNRQILQLDRVVAGMVTIGAIGLFSSGMMALLQWLSMPWRRSINQKPQGSAKRVESSSSVTRPRRSPSNLVVDHTLNRNDKTIEQVVLNNKGCAVKVNDLYFAYIRDSIVIEDFNLEVKPGEAFCILGPSGVGKTTFLRVLAGLEEPGGGSILVGGRPHKDSQDRIAMVFQSSGLFPWKTALQNIEFALLDYVEVGQQKRVAAKFLELVRLGEKSDAYPHQLSGGQQQRVGVARALANNPKLLLLDEPFAALDSITREGLQEEISNLLALGCLTVLLVTHDISEALFMSDRVAVMTREGKLTGEVNVNAPRPRDSKFRHSVEFNQLRKTLWATLNAEA